MEEGVEKRTTTEDLKSLSCKKEWGRKCVRTGVCSWRGWQWYYWVVVLEVADEGWNCGQIMRNDQEGNE